MSTAPFTIAAASLDAVAVTIVEAELLETLQWVVERARTAAERCHGLTPTLESLLGEADDAVEDMTTGTPRIWSTAGAVALGGLVRSLLLATEGADDWQEEFADAGIERTDIERAGWCVGDALHALADARVRSDRRRAQMGGRS